jgi:hypothetical protein
MLLFDQTTLIAREMNHKGHKVHKETKFKKVYVSALVNFPRGYIRT